MRLQEMMHTEVVTIAPEEAASTAWARMQQRHIRHLVVVEGRHLVGVLSDRDLGGRNGAPVRRGRKVRELMTRETVNATPRTTLRQAANLMRGRTIGSLPIFEDDRLVGIVTATDVLDELGRGSTRPTGKDERPPLRLPAGHEQIGGRTRQPKARGRARLRKPDSATRAPMPAQIPRPLKRAGGREPTHPVPANLRTRGVDLDPLERTYIERKLGTKLGKFARSIERVSVRMSDINGPRGGVDQRCRIKVVLSGLPSVIVERRDENMYAAVDGALEAAERTVRRSIDRRREKPLHTRGVPPSPRLAAAVAK